MNKFILRSLYFFAPFLLLGLYYSTYNTPLGDLSRLGKISINKNYRTQFSIDTTQTKPTKTIEDLILTVGNNKIDLLTIGDSYSQNKYGYQSQLEKKYAINTYNFQEKYFDNGNPVQTLFSILNSDFLDSIQIQYIALEIVNREIYNYFGKIDTLGTMGMEKLRKKKIKPVGTQEQQSSDMSIFRDLIDYPLYTLLYKFDNNAFFSQTYKLRINKELFTYYPNTLLCFDRDIDNINLCTEESIKRINSIICNLSERLNKKGIKLIFIPVPDKYDMYYSYISHKMPINPFFNLLRKQNKYYLFMDTKLILSKHIEQGVKDVYLFDDTHWSAVGHEIIADELSNFIK